MVLSTLLPSLPEIEAAFAHRYGSLALLATQGGQGVVCRATTTAGKSVALKIYKISHVDQRSEREVTALRQLKSTHIVRLHDAGAISIGDDIYRFIATTFVEGSSVATLLQTGPLELTAAARITADVADAVDELWHCPQKIVHRDIKPDNIIVEPRGDAVLIDLGIARHLSQTPITTAGHTYGTLGYFAPEHINGRPLSCKADIFALGIVFQEMIIGHHPTWGQQAFLMAGGPRIATLSTNVPAVLAALMDAMVAKRAFDRPTPAQVRGTLHVFLGRKAG